MSDFQRSLQFQGRNLQRQWQEKPLLRMAIWSLCLLLVVHLVMLSMDWREERGEEYRRLAGEWLKLQDVSRQTAWPERAMQAEQVLNLQRERFWRQVSVEFLELNNMLSPMLNLQLSFLFVAAY